MIAPSAILQISGRARLLLFVMTFTAPVIATGLDPRAAAAASFTTFFAFPGGSNGADPFAAVTQGRSARSTARHSWEGAASATAPAGPSSS
jgi:hypothetical protein